MAHTSAEEITEKTDEWTKPPGQKKWEMWGCYPKYPAAGFK